MSLSHSFPISWKLAFKRQMEREWLLVIGRVWQWKWIWNDLRCMFHSPGTGTLCIGWSAYDTCSYRICVLDQKLRRLTGHLPRHLLYSAPTICWTGWSACRMLDCHWCSLDGRRPSDTLCARSCQLCLPMYYLYCCQWQLRFHCPEPLYWRCLRYY